MIQGGSESGERQQSGNTGTTSYDGLLVDNNKRRLGYLHLGSYGSSLTCY